MAWLKLAKNELGEPRDGYLFSSNNNRTSSIDAFTQSSQSQSIARCMNTTIVIQRIIYSRSCSWYLGVSGLFFQSMFYSFFFFLFCCCSQQVTQMYQHPSLINPIRVYITDIVYLHKLEEVCAFVFFCWTDLDRKIPIYFCSYS